ncbi:MAG: acetyl-CoA carboxylase carboxyltransferase subunit beta [Deltaproteobacteria bacterium]|nr:acetyl-CoA carboxylase carboxyltransferase subunit beta [Deltaproteobacteria bacterium]
MEEKGSLIQCPECLESLPRRELERNLRVCPKCNHYFRLPAAERLAASIDPGTFREMDAGLDSLDPLSFRDRLDYRERVRQAQLGTRLKEALIGGQGRIGGQTAMVGVMDFNFLGGSMGSVVGEKIARLAERAVSLRCGLVIFCASGGARMQEGILSLMQMAKTSAALAQLKEERLPYIAVLTDPTTGGVSASFAMQGDVILAEPRAIIGFAGQRVIEQTIKQNLPDGFQRSEYLFAHGLIDRIVERKDLKGLLARLLALLPRATPAGD